MKINQLIDTKQLSHPVFSSRSKFVVDVFVHHCNINVLHSHGTNALHYSREKDCLEIFKFMYDIGCKMDVINALGIKECSLCSM